MRRIFWKSAIAGLAAIALAGCIAMTGCSSDSTPTIKDANSASKEKVSLSFFGYKTDAMNLTAIDSAIQSFMDKNGNIDITYDSLKGDDYWVAFGKRDSANELDDVFMMHHDKVLELGQQGKLADLSDLPGIESFTDDARGQFTNSDGSIYFLPTQNSTYNLYINTDLLEANGQPIPTNWNEFKQVCDYFTAQGITPIIANYRNALNSVILGKGLFDLYQLPADQLEAKLAEFNANPSLYAEAVLPGIQMASDMIQSGWIDPEETLVTNQTSDDLELFVKGDRPFMITGGWATARVKAKDPQFEYGVYPLPILDDGAVLPVQVDTNISVNANGPHVEEAKAFVAHLIEPDVMWAYCDTQSSYTPLKDSRKPTEETLEPSVEFLQNGRIVLRSEYRLDLPTEAAVTAAAKTLLNGGDVEAAQAALLAALSK